MQGQGDNKHSIDSDDEEDDREKFATFDKMAEDNELLEGQEDDTVAQDGEIKITPFNLKEEQQEGSFSKDGNFVWNKKDEVKDAWLDDVDMQKVSISIYHSRWYSSSKYWWRSSCWWQLTQQYDNIMISMQVREKTTEEKEAEEAAAEAEDEAQANLEFNFLY